ncbi:MAG: FAD-dependent oxidoreductase [Thermomicrobiales bacterium]
MSIVYDRATLPVLRTAEVAVCGGSFAGVAAALAVARAGRSVIVIEPRTYLGREITATGRYWIGADSQAAVSDLPELVRACVEATGDEALGDEIPLKPQAVKVALEDLLLAAGVEILYASLPVQVLARDGAVAGLVIGNKSGRQAITCRAIIDATETAIVSRLAGAAFAPQETKTACYTRVLEFDRVQPIEASRLDVPADLGLAGNAVRLHRGYHGPRHMLVECQFILPADADIAGQARRETEARHRSLRLASHLIKHEPAFAKAFLASASYELLGPQTDPLAGGAPAWVPADGVSGAVVCKGSGALRLESLASPLRNLWCLGDAAWLQPQQRPLFQDAVAASRAGEALGDGVIRHWQTLVGEQGSPVTAEPDASVEPDASTLASADEAADDIVVREFDSPQRGRPYRRIAVPSSQVPVLGAVDVLVAGGGTSGVPAAIAASREGMRTLLIEMGPELGGTGTLGGIDSYWGGRRVAFCTDIVASVREVQDSLNYDERGAGGNFNRRWSAEPKMYALRREAEQAGVELLFGTFAIGALVEASRSTVRGVIAATPYGPYALLAGATIDATGDGDVAAFAGADSVYGSERDHGTLYHSLNPYNKPGRTLNVKSSQVDVGNIEDYTRALLAGHRRGGMHGEEIHDHAIYLATRESRHILGDVTLTMTDQLLHRCWPDVVNIHFSNHDIKGKSGADWVNVGLIPPHLDTEIPYRALTPRNLDGILIGGKAYSTTHDGLAGPRMMSDLENQGGVVGLAASQAIRAGCQPREIDVRALQERLVEVGLLPGDVLTRHLAPRRHSDADLAALVVGLKEEAEHPLHAYSDMKLTDRYDGPITFVEVCTAGPRIVPLLERALATAEGAHRMRIAQALAMYGAESAAPVLAAAIERLLAGGSLPARDEGIRHVGWSPDQGAMPDACYLLYSLGQTREPLAVPIWRRVVDLVEPTEDDFLDRNKGIFYYIDAICYGADRLADPLAVPILEALHGYAPLRDQVARAGFQVDIFDERRAMLEVAIGRALARCGSAHGYEILIAYLADNRALQAEAAHAELAALAGCDHGKDQGAWRGWLSATADSLSPQPYEGRLDMPAEDEEILRPAITADVAHVGASG